MFSQVSVRPQGVLRSQILSREGTPVLARGYPSPVARTGESPRRQRSRADTCYAAGDMPLAVRQGDFLVFSIFNWLSGMGSTGIFLLSIFYHYFEKRIS